MDVRIVLVDDGTDGEWKRTAISSLVLAGQFKFSQVVADAEFRVAADSDAKYSHILTSRTVVLPSFYDAMVAACEHANADYAFCHCAVLADYKHPELVASPIPEKFAIGQFLVRLWVLRELGTAASIPRVLSEYRGVEVPHVLCVETSL